MATDEESAAEARMAGGVAKHIARAAARLFASDGYEATSVRTIVEAAGVTKPTLYYHYGSKEGLAKALVTDPLTGLAEALRACLAATDDPTAGLVAQVDEHFRFMRDDPDRGRFFYAMAFGPHGRESGLAAMMMGLGRQIDEAMLAGVDRLVRAGLVEEGRAARFATALHGVIVVHTLDFLCEKSGCRASVGEADGAGLARTIVGDLLRGFGAGPRDAAT